MKKTIVAVAAAASILIGMPRDASAGSGFDLGSGGFGIWTASSGNNPLPVGSYVQLIWTLDFAYAAALEGALNPVGYGLAGDYLLFEGNSSDFLGDQTVVPPFSSGGGWSGDLDGNNIYTDAMVGGNVIQNGYVYARVFNAPDLASTVGGTAFLQTGLVNVDHDSTNVQSNPDNVSFDGSNPVYTDDVMGAFTGGSVLNQTVTAVPEPSVFAFLGIGAAVLGLRRKMARS